MAKIISMVPSWTEMLIDSGVPLVGRTRFCIEPRDKVASIPAVGGTKDWDIDIVRAIAPDLLILDKDENPKSMSKSGIPFVATHVRDLKSCADGILQIKAEIEKLGLDDSAIKLAKVAKRWTERIHAPPVWKMNHDSWDTMPGLVEWIRRPTSAVKNIYYIIWRNPWMVATAETFIGHVAAKAGLPLTPFETRLVYPELDIEALEAGDDTLFLFSSEPFPFHKKVAELKAMGVSAAVVDGQKFSWFGIGALSMIER